MWRLTGCRVMGPKFFRKTIDNKKYQIGIFTKYATIFYGSKIQIFKNYLFFRFRN